MREAAGHPPTASQHTPPPNLSPLRAEPRCKAAVTSGGLLSCASHGSVRVSPGTEQSLRVSKTQLDKPGHLGSDMRGRGHLKCQGGQQGPGLSGKRVPGSRPSPHMPAVMRPDTTREWG